MGTNVKYVGAVTNRDPDLMMDLKQFFKRYGIETIELEPSADIDTVLLTKYQVRLILPKLMTAKWNGKLFKKLRKTKLHCLNSIQAIEICQSRRRMFGHIELRLPHIRIPRMYKRLKSIRKALAAGQTVWVRRDAHNIPKEERVLGIVDSMEALSKVVQYHSPSDLFFQAYLGPHETLYKVYVIGQEVFCLRRTGYQDGFERNRDELDQARQTLDDELRATILEIGDAFNMAVYGVDFIEHDGEPVIVDVNDFPSFRGIPEAPRTIYEYIYHTYLAEPAGEPQLGP